MNRKKIVRIIIETVIVIALIIGFILLNDQIIENRLRSFVPIYDSNSYAYQVESIKEVEDSVVITGWFFQLKKVENKEKKVSAENNFEVLLCDIDLEIEKDLAGKTKSLKGIKTEVERIKRDDVNNYFECEYDYSLCGFKAKVDKKALDTQNGQYEIIFKTDVEEKNGIKSGIFIDKGIISHISPKDEIRLDVEGTYLERIVKDGVCLASYPDFHICVYQYGWKLYWIADKDYFFEDDGSTYIQYQLETTQFDKLPTSRTSNGWYSSNIGENFEDREITNEVDCGKYRVCVRDIPTEYSVTRIVTGYYTDGRWVWQRSFRPIYFQ